MILNSSPENKAVLSNVGQINEFKIRNSAKAFNILSSGLYSNKIRAIIRELSCNAVDSHVAAGKENVPFDVHLPNTIEPWFSIRDYGTGLDHDQVCNIYTTYFESTKAESNDFIGALGLGSKSPFSYTDNFTVTAIKDNIKRIYTAFINEHGVPSIALMTTSNTNEPNGVEVKFSVNNRLDFQKFIDEAKNVYEYFKLRPVIHGCANFKFIEVPYLEKDIIKGIHTCQFGLRGSYAIMGSISYPIDVPNAPTVLGDLRFLLDCGLLIEFDIGELDFQASREHLSYVPSTIQVIKNKLELLNNNLLQIITSEANKLTNYWDRADYLFNKKSKKIWHGAVQKYINNTNFVLDKPFEYPISDLAVKFNIKINGFTKYNNEIKTRKIKPKLVYVPGSNVESYCFPVSPHTYFVVNDTNVGSYERAKYHFNNEEISEYVNVFILDKAGKDQPMLVEKFLLELKQPKRVIYTSKLHKKERKSSTVTKNSNFILKLKKNYSYKKIQWVPTKNLDSFSDNETFYYVQLSGYQLDDEPFVNGKDMYETLLGSGVYTGDIYGIRKNQIDSVKNKKNWVRLKDHVKNLLDKSVVNYENSLVKNAVDYKNKMHYIKGVASNSPYSLLHNKLEIEFANIPNYKYDSKIYFTALCKMFNVALTKSDVLEQKSLLLINEIEKTLSMYPLLKYIKSCFDAECDLALAQYINMIDKQKGN